MAQGRQGLVKLIKEEQHEELGDLSLGKQTLMVQLTANKGWLVFLWNHLSVSEAL